MQVSQVSNSYSIDQRHSEQDKRQSGKDLPVLHLISKLLVLVIVCTCFTLILVGVIVMRMLSDQLSHLPQTIQSIAYALDIFASMFAIYSQFGFGEWLYKAICWKCHMPVLNSYINRLPALK